jgi:DNA gyrase/topoisomerase IV subunit B
VLLPAIGYDFGFVNGAVCSAGTHMRKAQKKIIERFLEIFKKKDMELITETDVKNAISLFVCVSVKNPDYDAQTKTNLTNPIPSDTLSLPKAFLDGLESSIIVENMVEYYQVKYAKEQKKLLKKLNDEIKKTKSKKFTPCSNRNNKELNSLYLFEGTSAANGFAMYANPQTMAAYELRGKVKNTLNLTKSEIVENQELREIISILNLQFNDAQNNIKNCNYGRIVFATDMDYDGHHICGLLITFFAMFFPELFIAKKIHRILSPIVIAAKGKEERYYYTMDEYEADRSNVKGWEISYKKGLGSLEDAHYEEMFTNQRLMQFKLKDKNYMTTVKTWFDSSTALRKELLLDAGDAGTVDEGELEHA